MELFFLESYGAFVFDDPAARDRLALARNALAQSVAANGRYVVSAFVRSPTFGGASDLAHLSLLSGIDLSDPLRHHLLLASDRPTLIQVPMENAPTPTPGHWDINDIYRSGQ